jgi:hypothetical protein
MSDRFWTSWATARQNEAKALMNTEEDTSEASRIRNIEQAFHEANSVHAQPCMYLDTAFPAVTNYVLAMSRDHHFAPFTLRLFVDKDKIVTSSNRLLDVCQATSRLKPVSVCMEVSCDIDLGAWMSITKFLKLRNSDLHGHIKQSNAMYEFSLHTLSITQCNVQDDDVNDLVSIFGQQQIESLRILRGNPRLLLHADSPGVAGLEQLRTLAQLARTGAAKTLWHDVTSEHVTLRSQYTCELVALAMPERGHKVLFVAPNVDLFPILLKASGLEISLENSGLFQWHFPFKNFEYLHLKTYSEGIHTETLACAKRMKDAMVEVGATCGDVEVEE